MELTRLQRNFEACVSEIDTLEKNKTSSATMYALILGIIGTAFIAGSTFAVVAQPPHIVLCILLAIQGFLGGIFLFFCTEGLWENRRKKSHHLLKKNVMKFMKYAKKGADCCIE